MLGRPGGVAAAVAEASLVTNEDPASTELVTVGAATRGMGDPLPGGCLHELAQHHQKPMTRDRRVWS